VWRPDDVYCPGAEPGFASALTPATGFGSLGTASGSARLAVLAWAGAVRFRVVVALAAAVAVRRAVADATPVRERPARARAGLPAGAPASRFCACSKSRCSAFASLPLSRRALDTKEQVLVQIACAPANIALGVLAQLPEGLLGSVQGSSQPLERGWFLEIRAGSNGRGGLFRW
jgi:hypothetical protein